MSVIDDDFVGLAETSATLRIYGDSLEPERVSSRLGCRPTASWKKGELIPEKRRYVAKQGMWQLESTMPSSAAPDRHVTFLLSQVTSDVRVWQEVTSGLSCDIFFGSKIVGDNVALSLSSHIVRSLGARGLAVSFDFYVVIGDDAESGDR